MTAYKPHPKNAPGPFYVCDGCCTACGVPWTQAPDLFVYDEDVSHCYVARQPENKGELDRMIRAAHDSELECIRYAGSDNGILRRIAEAGLAHLADETTNGIKPLVRDHVSFNAADPRDNLMSENDLATAFQQFVRSWESTSAKFTQLHSNGERVHLSYAWFEKDFHRVELEFIGNDHARWLIVSDTPFHVYDWLASDARFCNIRWYTQEEWNTRGTWQETPW